MKAIRTYHLAAWFFALSLVSLPALATDLRGRVDGLHGYTQRPFPMGGARVDLIVMTAQGPRRVRSAYTGGNGMYYMPGIAPGSYTLQVNGRDNYPLSVFPRPYQDIPPILFR